MTTLSLERVSRPGPGGYREVTPAELAQAEYSGRILDVREPAEFNAELGHLARAELVPLATVPRIGTGMRSWSWSAAPAVAPAGRRSCWPA